MARKVNFQENKNTLHLVTRPLLLTARVLGMFPVSGLTSSNPNNLRFVLRSPYNIIVILSISGQCINCLLSLIHLFESGTNPRTFYKFIFNAAGAICTLIIMKLAKIWPAVVKEANVIEKSLSKFHQKNINSYCRAASITVFICATVELVLNINFYGLFAKECFQDKSLLESYYKYTMPACAAYIPYQLWIFIVMQIVNIQTIFVANFTDVLIMVVSFYLTAYFDELNNLIDLYKNKSPSIWNVLRVHYTKLTRLVKLVDDSISSFILFSFGSNMALICVQLFKLLRKRLAHSFVSCESKSEMILASANRAMYFHFSIVFLIMRAILTALFATRVHGSARAPLFTLYEVPSCSYSNEARRFVEQMHANTVALSGQHFFYVTRGMILSMVATLFTYELVLLQFSDSRK